MSFIFVYVTNPDLSTAEKIATHLLKKRLIACANIFRIKSAYWWKGKIEKAPEVVAILKTRKINWEKVKKEIKNIHPYTVPCIVRIPVSANEEFEKWLHFETSST